MTDHFGQTILNFVFESEDFGDGVKAKLDEFVRENAFEDRVLTIVRMDELDHKQDEADRVKEIIDEHIGDVDEIRSEIVRLRNEIILSRHIANDLQERLSALETEDEGEEVEAEPSNFWIYVVIFFAGVLTASYRVVGG